MTREQTIEAIRVMQAFVDGKEVECLAHGYDGWDTTNNPMWNWAYCTFRIKPTATFRPWTADEVPLGAQVRSKTYHPDYRSLITTSGNPIHRESWLNGYEHSTDGGKNWLPCGVGEEAK